MTLQAVTTYRLTRITLLQEGTVRGSVEAVRVDHFEQLVVVAIVDVNADEYRAIAVIQSSPQDRRDLFGGLNHHPLGIKRLGVLNDIHRTEFDARWPAILGWRAGPHVRRNFSELCIHRPC